MSDSSSSYRQILKSTSIMGGASVINVLIGLVRIKLVAVMFGPVGIGFLALLNNIMAVASTVAAMGLRSAGTRQIAEAAGKEDDHNIAVASRALLIATAVLSVLGAAVTWLLREPIAEYVLGSAEKADAVAWIAVGVFLTVVSGSQGALLNGLRKINELAKVTIYSSLFSTLIGVPLLWLFGEVFLPAFAVILPLATFLTSFYFTRELKSKSIDTNLAIGQIKDMLKMGSAFMLSGLVSIGALLVVRSIVGDKLGLDGVGYFEAAWIISMSYVGIVLGAMGSDFYPRLTAVIKDRQASSLLVNQQTKVAVYLLAPLLVLVMGFAPLIVWLLYSSEFSASVEILRWQVFGDVLKIMSWPLAFVLASAGLSMLYLLAEVVAAFFFIVLVWVLVDEIGVVSVGYSFIGMYVAYLVYVYIVARRVIGLSLDRGLLKVVFALMLALVFIFLLADYSEIFAVGASVVLSMLFFWVALEGLSLKGRLSSIMFFRAKDKG